MRRWKVLAGEREPISVGHVRGDGSPLHYTWQEGMDHCS